MIKNEKHIIRETHLAKLDNLSKFNEYPEIRHLVLFGSFATGKSTVFSDIDVSYIANESLSFSKEPIYCII